MSLSNKILQLNLSRVQRLTKKGSEAMRITTKPNFGLQCPPVVSWEAVLRHQIRGRSVDEACAVDDSLIFCQSLEEMVKTNMVI